jgi:hypothetical protein
MTSEYVALVPFHVKRYALAFVVFRLDSRRK